MTSGCVRSAPAGAGLRRVWRLAVATFVVAGSTGLGLRLAALTGLPAGLQMDHVRHAHSHLMYFGWATPMLVALIGDRVERMRPAAAGAGRIAVVALAAAWSSYLPFLLAGYAPLDVAGVRLPLSIVTAALNMLAWWWFVGWYWRATRDLDRDVPLRLFDAAIGLLVASSVGALLRGVVDAVGVPGAFARQAPIHAFLDLFADGWFLLAVLGLAWTTLTPSRPVPRRLVPVLLSGTLPVFLLTLPVDLVPVALRAGAAATSLLGLVALAWLVRALWASSAGHPAWRLVLSFVGVRIGAGILLLHPASAQWAMSTGLRVLHLHVMGLGVLTGGLIAVCGERGLLRPRRARHWRFAIVAVVVSLLLLSGLVPTAVRGQWMLVVVAVTAALPVVVAAAWLRDRTVPQPVVTQAWADRSGPSRPRVRSRGTPR